MHALLLFKDIAEVGVAGGVSFLQEVAKFEFRHVVEQHLYGFRAHFFCQCVSRVVES